MVDPSSGALSGVTVIAIEQAVAAPFCTSRLADAGARRRQSSLDANAAALQRQCL